MGVASVTDIRKSLRFYRSIELLCDSGATAVMGDEMWHICCRTAREESKNRISESMQKIFGDDAGTEISET